MKRLMSLIAVIMLATSLLSAHSYAPSSVLNEGTFVKIRISDTGLYSISFDELKKMGITPANVRLYGYGGAMLTQDFSKEKTDDLPLIPVYLDRANERMIFFAQGSVDWTFNGTRFVHRRNPYSDYGYYFLTSDLGEPEEIRTEAVPSATAQSVVNSYTDYRLHEEDLVNLIDRSGVEGGGRNFYGEQFKPDTTRHFTMEFDGLLSEPSSFLWNISLAAASTSSSSFNISMDGQTATAMISAISTSDFYTKATTATSQVALTPAAGSSKDIAITYSCNNSSAVGFLDFIEVNACCALQLSGNKPLFFRTITGYGTTDYIRFEIAGASDNTQVWDISNPKEAFRVSANRTASGTLQFTAQNTTAREYVAFDPQSTSYLSAESLGKIGNQNLHGMRDIDMVIISPEEFISEAERLAEAHRQYDNMTVAVVTDQQVYNEFSSGTPDATAYRWLMKMLYDRAYESGGSIQAPRYLCLFGDGTFDNRRILKNFPGNNWLLTYQAENSVSEIKAYATDDYFCFLDDNEGLSDITGRMDIGVGRLPVNTLEQASRLVDKLIRHISGGNKGKWKSQLVFLADDGDSNLHTSCADQAGESVRKNNPDFITNKIYLDAYTQEVNASGESYPLAQAKLNNLLQNGALLFDYCGHSGYNNASSEGLITSAGVRAMQNDNQAFWIFASCSFALFDAGKVSAAEEAILNPDGGAIAVCASDRTVFASQNAVLNRHICDSLFHHTTPFGYHNRIGDAVRLGKNACGSDENKMAYVLLGDPAVSLHFPTDYQVVTTSIPDTLNALQVATVEGLIKAETGDTATWFNGRLNVCIYDKMQQVTTLDNDQNDDSEKIKYTYNDYPNILFQGQTTIKEGRFSYTFMVPKDIRYNFGNGRIVYYALDSISGEEGVGHYEDFAIGGSSAIEIDDTDGPHIEMYLGSTIFADGDKTNETPHFFAQVEDEHGINTVGNGIGHDLLLIVDNKPAESYVLNDYFSATNNSYQQGMVSYQMVELPEGKHSLMFRAWDLLNNSSTAELNFEVVYGMDPSIVNVVCYPNPVSLGETVTVRFEYNQPDVAMQADLYVYDLAGCLVHTISQRGSEAIIWNTSGTTTSPGIYIYKLQISSPTAKTCSRNGKLIITK